MTVRRLHRARVRRRAFTLMEVLLVLAILVALTAIAWPMLDKAFAHRRLFIAADQVRAAWGGARVDAMDSGQTYVFQYCLDGGNYRIECKATAITADDPLFGDLFDQPAAGASNPTSMGGANSTGSQSKKLPEGVTFAGSQTAADTRAAALGAVTDQAGSDSADRAAAGWSDPILFYPDGTTSTAQLALQNQNNRCIILSLRGLTGTITVGEIQLTEELQR